MSKPTLTPLVSGVQFHWEQEQVQITVTRIHETRNGPVTGEVLIRTTRPGWPRHIRQAQLNFTSSPTRDQWVKALNPKYDAPWHEIMETLCVLTLEYIRQGEPVVELDPLVEIPPPSYYVKPLMPKNKPSVIFGEGGTTKSYLGVALAACLHADWKKNPMGFELPEGRKNVMYLDWETDQEELSWRWKCILNGAGLPYSKLPYLRCVAPLPDDLERIQEKLIEWNTEAIIIDSMAGAAGGELNKDDTATRLFTAIRRLKTTALIIAHTSKPNGDGKTATIFGSVFFGNWSRSVFEVQKVQEPDEDTIDIGIYHRKTNQSKLFKPIGLKVNFGEDYTRYSRQNVDDIIELSKHLSMPQKIEGLLKNFGQMTVKEIASELGEKEDAVSVGLNRLKKSGKADRFPNGWGLLVKEGVHF